MEFDIRAVMEHNNQLVFQMHTHYIPRINEEIECSAGIFIVKYVRYQLANGNFSSQSVQLGLEYKKGSR